MTAALARKEIAHPSAERDALIARYRRRRAIAKEIHSGALDHVSEAAMIGQAKRLGLAMGRTLVLDQEEELDLIFDLAIHTAPPDRTRAIDRYARAAAFPPGSEEAVVLEAMRNAQFALLRLERRHPVAGVIVTDIIRGTESWLMDEGVEQSAPDGMPFAARLSYYDDFATTCGIIIPLDRELVEAVFDEVLARVHGTPHELAQDRRFATSVYRHAIALGVMEDVRYAHPEEDA